MPIRQTIYGKVKEIAEQQRKSICLVTDDTQLLESGLDSLCIAILIASLDDALDLNPFDIDDAVMPDTFGELIQMYEHAATVKAA